MLIAIDTEDHLGCPEGGIMGTAYMDVDAGNYLNADCGGWDGPHVEATLDHVTIGAWKITRADLVTAVGESTVARFEEIAANEVAMGGAA